MKLSLFMYNPDCEETRVLSEMLSEDFTIISFNNIDHATQFISGYYNWFDAAVIYDDHQHYFSDEGTLIDDLSRQNQEMTFAIITNEKTLTESKFHNNQRSVTYLTRPIEREAVNLFTSLAKYNSKKADVMDLWS